MSDFLELIDLANERLGGAALTSSDDFFAPVENLVRASTPVFLDGKYTDRGKWMDGWESRRKRTPGHDWAIVRLGLPGVVRGVVVDTAFFKGNYPDHAAIEGCWLPGHPEVAQLVDPATQWTELLPKSPLKGDSRNLFEVDAPFAVTHLRLHIFPDGGVARLRVHGEVAPDWRRLLRRSDRVDLAAVEHGGRAVVASDMFFGSRHNLLMPGLAANMGDGWETKRRRGPGHDWVIIELGARGTIDHVLLDTAHFKGNFPDTASIEVCDAPGASVAQLTSVGHFWRELLPRTKLLAHTKHHFDEALAAAGPATHARLNIYPDGGVSRLRLFGSVDPDSRAALGVRRVDTLAPAAAEAELRACCGSAAWARKMAAARPFGDLETMARRADEIWAGLGPDDWLEAFRAHPKIGERRPSATTTAWSEQEQAGARGAAEATLAALAEVNAAYEARFGHIFLICATGRSADEMLAAARERLHNEPAQELRVAAEEQRRITRLRLEKLVRS